MPRAKDTIDRSTTEGSGMKPRIGFVGLGNMGGPMCLRLVEAGYPVTAFDLSAAALERVVDRGARARERSERRHDRRGAGREHERHAAVVGERAQERAQGGGSPCARRTAAPVLGPGV